jgi:hypothetical protein
MTTKPIFHCCCNQAIQNPYLSFERRVEKLSVIEQGGKPVTAINIATCQVMFMYCSHECWQTHQSEIAEALELKVTFPAFNFITPCCRCGKAVNRTQHYVCYSISEMEMEGDDVLIGHCLDDHDFAVVCRDCEEPDLTDTATASDNTKEEEEAFA